MVTLVGYVLPWGSLPGMSLWGLCCSYHLVFSPGLMRFSRKESSTFLSGRKTSDHQNAESQPGEKKKSSCLIIIFNHHIFNLAVHLTLTFSVTLCLRLSREISSLLPRPTRWVGEGRHVWERQWSNPTFASQVPGTSSLEPSGGLWCAACFPFCLCFLLLSMF